MACKEQVTNSRHIRRASLAYILAMRTQSAASKSRETQSTYPNLHGELLLRICGKPADVGNHTGSFAILQISIASLSHMRHSGLAPVGKIKYENSQNRSNRPVNV